MLSRCFFDFSVGVEAFVIGPSQTSFFFSFHLEESLQQNQTDRPKPVRNHCVIGRLG